ncbi:MAG: glycosyltransferase [Gemmataceae bacterium]|nr:glycosyltransferase [Gemmataceae bacterium]
MRVALLSGNAPRHNAVGNQIAEKVRFFQERGAEVRLFVQDASRLHPDLQTCAVELAEPRADGPAWEYLRQADLILAIYAQYFDLLQLLPCLAGAGPRIVFDYHGVTPPEMWHDQHREGLEQSARQRGYVWCADHALTTSQANARELGEATHFPPEHTTTLPLTVNLDYLGAEPRERYFQRRLGIDAPILLYVGRLAGNKRVSVLIEALAKLDDETAHVVCVGDTSDVYAEEAARCQSLAEQLGVAKRVHWIGQLDDADLARAYRSADVLVMPSLHEGFCLPVVEAMACGLPVIASRSPALPETVGDAGLTFVPNDVEDLVRKIRRVLNANLGPDIPVWPGIQEGLAHTPRRIAVVSFRFGPEIVGGAETSLRTMARALRDAGHHVEVFTTCTTSESHWKNDASPSDVTLDGLRVHRFPIDTHDSAAHGDAFRIILEADGHVPADTEERYLRLSIHSSALVAALRRRRNDFAAIITGPYLFGLTADIAAEFPEKTLLVPCFHDEPLGRLNVWPQLYGNVGGILYHSAEEQAFAQARLGVNHPNSREIGTWLPPASLAAPPARLNARPYVVYCGRYSEQKNLPLLLEWAQRYQAENPDRVDFVFMGQGNFKLPEATWLRDLGRVDEATKHAVLAGATALVQLSTQESLSLVVLEAWAQGTPVIVHRDCPVLAGQVARAQGGITVANFDSFTNAVNQLSGDESVRNAYGTKGRAHVDTNYAGADKYATTLLAAIDALRESLRQQMRTRGLERAQQFGRPVWQQRFAEFIENLLTQPARARCDDLAIEPLRESIQAAIGTRTLLVPVRVSQRGTLASASEGPGRTLICCEIRDEAGEVVAHTEISLPTLLMPGQAQVAALPIPLPSDVGSYHVSLWPERTGGVTEARRQGNQETKSTMSLILSPSLLVSRSPCLGTFLDTVNETLPKAHHLQQLPADYVDVTEGTLAPVKRLIKQKLLNNFKHAYVDVLSRQQSQVNRHLVLMIQQLAECCAMLDHTVAGLHQRMDGVEAKLEQALSTLSAPATLNEEGARVQG